MKWKALHKRYKRSYNVYMNSKTKHIILLLIRLAVGGIILQHGVEKLMDMDKFISMLGEYFGLSAGVIWAVALGETLAGLGIIFGVYTQTAAIGAGIIMAGAVYYTKAQAMDAILLLIGSLVLIYTGSGSYAIAPSRSSVKNVQI